MVIYVEVQTMNPIAPKFNKKKKKWLVPRFKT